MYSSIVYNGEQSNQKILEQTNLFCHSKMGSLSRSDMSTALRLASTAGWGVSTSQPTCENQKPLRASCGSEFVSLNLWCTLWSKAQACTCLYTCTSITWKTLLVGLSLSWSIKHFATSKKLNKTLLVCLHAVCINCPLQTFNVSLSIGRKKLILVMNQMKNI